MQRADQPTLALGTANPGPLSGSLGFPRRPGKAQRAAFIAATREIGGRWGGKKRSEGRLKAGAKAGPKPEQKPSKQGGVRQFEKKIGNVCRNAPLYAGATQPQCCCGV
jgi:hypothetical protein